MHTQQHPKQAAPPGMQLRSMESTLEPLHCGQPFTLIDSPPVVFRQKSLQQQA